MTSIASDAFAGCPEEMIVHCAYDSETFYWTLEQDSFSVDSGVEMGSVKLYLRTAWLDALGLEFPETIDELLEVITVVAENDPDGNGLMDEVGLTAFYEEYFFMALNNLDSSFTEEQMAELIESGRLKHYQTATRPFDANAFAIANDILPERVASEYTLLTFPAATPTATPTPTPTPTPNLPQLAAPTELAWGKYYGGDELLIENYPGMIAYRAADANAELTYEHKVCVYRKTDSGDERVWKSTWTCRPESPNYKNDHDFVLHEELESGDYYFTVQAIGDDETCVSSEIVASEVWTYVNPGKRLAAPEGLTWTGEHTVTWTKSAEEAVGGYCVSLYYSATDANATSRSELEELDGFVDFFTDGEIKNTAEFYQGDFEQSGYYYFCVQHVSENVEVALHSENSALSAAYACGVETETTPAPTEAVKRAWIHQYLLMDIGLEMPATADELLAAINEFSKYDGLYGISAEDAADYYIAFAVFDQSYTSDTVLQMIEEGSLTSCTTGSDPFAGDPLVVVAAEVPEAYSALYVELTAPAAEVTPTPAPELRQLAAPTSLEWGTYYCWDELIMDNYPGMISWYAPTENMDIEHKYEVVIYRVTAEGAEKVETARFKKRVGAYQYSTHHDFVNNGIDESGDYYFTVQALGDDTTCTSSEIVTSAVWSYTLPSKVLAAPDGLVWDGMAARWNASDDEDAGGYTVSLYYSATDANATDTDALDRVFGFVWYFAEGSTEPVFEFGDAEFTDAGYYYFTVETVSANIENARHSPKSALSAAYAYGMETETTPAPEATGDAETTPAPEATEDAETTPAPEATEDAETTPAPTATPTPAPTDSTGTGSAVAWINLDWLEATGWTREELTYASYLIEAMCNVADVDANGNGQADEIGIAAASTDDFLIALQTVQPSFKKEMLDLMLASGDFCTYAVSETPFEENAMVVVWPELPAAYADVYVAL